MVCKWQVEIDDYARRVLEKHWPDVPRWDDVRTFPPDDGDWSVDVLCGGFPCQDISVAGKGAGIAGARSGLWSEFNRIIRVLRPKYVIVENVPALTFRGLGRVLGDMAESGYNAEWKCIPVCDFSLPHIRERVWIVAYRHGERKLQPGWGLEYKRRWISDRGKAIDWILSRGGVLRSFDGIPARLDRVKCLGNAVVPQVAEFIGRLIIEATERGVPR